MKQVFLTIALLGMIAGSTTLRAETCDADTQVNTTAAFARAAYDFSVVISSPVPTNGGGFSQLVANYKGFSRSETSGAGVEYIILKNSGPKGAPGDKFTVLTSASANTATTSSVDSNALKYDLIYSSCTYGGIGQYTTNVIADRTPDCDGTNTCREYVVYITDGSDRTVSCDYVNAHPTFSYYRTVGNEVSGGDNWGPAITHYAIACRRLQDNVEGSVTVHSKWVRFLMDFDSPGNCSYSYENSTTRN